MTSIRNGSPKRRNPTVLIDRSLMPQFAQSLRDAGFSAHSLADVFPDRAQQVSDVEWIQYAGERGWIVLTANPTMCRNIAELEAIRLHGARVFSLGSAQEVTAVRGLVFGRWWLSMMRRARRPSGCFWRLYFGRPPIKTIR